MTDRKGCAFRFSNPELMQPGFSTPRSNPSALVVEWRSALETLGQWLYAFRTDDDFRPSHSPDFSGTPDALLPPLTPDLLGDPGFKRDHRVRFNYMTGAMANGIASTAIVESMARAGMLGIFGSAGLSPPRIEDAVLTLKKNLGNRPFGFNLIHSPNEQDHELATAELYLKHGIDLVEASAYLDLTPAIVRYRLHGIHRKPDGTIATPNRVIGKVSRSEVATRFLSPAPERHVKECVQRGWITGEQADLAKYVPMAADITVEADSGGHTDNRPAIALFPGMTALRDRLQKQHNYPVPVRVGLAGGISTPASIAAAFTMGAAYVCTGSVNQACVESGSCDAVREMLAQADQADVAMAPAADMFEMGVKVQVLKRGTMFAMRAGKLYELYRAYPSMEALPAGERESLEKNLFKAPLEEIWRQTREYFTQRDPNQVVKGDADPKHRMALVFRWYLGQSSRWANAGVPDRRLDYQVWCGPAMGAFNEWTKGSHLEAAKHREVAEVAKNLLLRAAVVLRQCQLRLQAVELPNECFPLEPLGPVELEKRWNEVA